MPLERPSLFGDAVPLDHPADEKIAPASSKGAGWVTLERCTVIAQEKTNWCWVATGQAIDHYYRNSNFAQCEIARDFLGPGVCNAGCTNCNDPHELQELLVHRELFQPPLSIRISFANVKKEIRKPKEHPICCHIDRPGGHFVIIYGFAENPARLALRDPAVDGDQWQLFDDFVKAYKHGGVWDQTYLTANHAEN